MSSISIATDGYLCSTVSIVTNGYVCLGQTLTTGNQLDLSIQPEIAEYTFRVEQPKLVIKYADGLLRIQQDDSPTVFTVEDDHFVVQEEQFEKHFSVQPEQIEYTFRVEQPKLYIRTSDGLLKIVETEDNFIFSVENEKFEIQ